ncbi:MAG: GldG family protein [Anaerolineales bacterium]
MKITNKRALGVGALVLGIAVYVVTFSAWFIGRDFNTWIQAGLAFGLVCFAAAAALEIDLLTQFLKSRQARFGAEAVGISLAFIAVIALLNFILNQDRLKRRWDLTETGEHSLAPETLDVLAELPEDVHTLAFYSPTSASRSRAQDLLDSYEFNSGGKFTYEFHDPDVEIALVQEYAAGPNSIVVELGDQRESVDFATEQSLTAALIRVLHPTERVLYFVTGHQERDPEQFGDDGLSQMADGLERVGYSIDATNLLGEALPEDADVLVLAGPLVPLAPEEVQKVGEFLDSGGSLIYMAEPTVVMSVQSDGTEPMLDYLTDNWGLRVRDDIVIDPTLSAQASPYWPASVTYGVGPITEGLEGLATIYPVARSIQVNERLPEGVTVSPLVQTSPNAWGETDFSTLDDGSTQPDGTDAVGQLNLAVTAENTITGARVVVFGDVDFASNGIAREVFGNGEIFQNAAKWASVEDELINLTPAPSVFRSHNITTVRDIAIVTLLACILPLVAVMVIGGSVWWNRRRMV